MEQKAIAIIFGGCSSEYKVSLTSASAILKELISMNRYKIIMIGITCNGQWFRYHGPIEKIENDTWCNPMYCTEAFFSPCRNQKSLIEFYGGHYETVKIDAVFPVLHGKNGEDGTIQGLLELANLPYVGCGVLSSALCMDKALTHAIIETIGIQVPKSVVIYQKDGVSGLKQAQNLKYPLFVKPARAGSSFGITKVLFQKDLWNAMKTAWQYDEKIVIEEGIDGFEVGCAVLGNHELTIGKVDEIELNQDFFDFHEKYSDQSGSVIHIPARITQQQACQIKKAAILIYETLGCKGMARIDFFLTPDANIVFNEVNTIPGFTSHSRFPNMLRSIGISFSEIIEQLIELALETSLEKQVLSK